MSYVNFNRALTRAEIEALGTSGHDDAVNGKIYFASNGGIYVGGSDKKAHKYAELNTDNDTKVTQTVTAASNTSYRPLLIGYSYSDATVFAPSASTNIVYATHLAKFKPDTGQLFIGGLGKLGTDGKVISGSTTTFFNTSGSTTTLSPVIQAGASNKVNIAVGGATSSDFTIPYATNAGSVAWNNVTDKPTSYPNNINIIDLR